MKVEVIEKGDNTVTVRFTGVSPMDATLMAMVKLGPADSASFGSSSGYGKDKVTFGGFYAEVIDAMQATENQGK